MRAICPKAKQDDSGEISRPREEPGGLHSSHPAYPVRSGGPGPLPPLDNISGPGRLLVLFAETKRTTLHGCTVAKEKPSNALEQVAEPLLPSSPNGESTSLGEGGFWLRPATWRANTVRPYRCTIKPRIGKSSRTTPSVSRKRLPPIRNLNRREQARLFRLIRSARFLSPLATLASLTSGREALRLSSCTHTKPPRPHSPWGFPFIP